MTGVVAPGWIGSRSRGAWHQQDQSADEGGQKLAGLLEQGAKFLEQSSCERTAAERPDDRCHAPRRQASRLRTELEALGACVIELPTIEIVPPDSYEPLDAALRDLSRYQWLIVTSANTARVLAERLAVLGIELADFSEVRVVAQLVRLRFRAA